MHEIQLVWYHIVLTTYGAWLHGDARGFRTRHHREHIEGDYKTPPPPDRYAACEQRSRGSLKQAAVELPPPLRSTVGTALKERLEGLGAFVLCMAVAGQHVHLLTKIPKGAARDWSGTAKQHAWFVLRERGWKGKLWGKRGKAVTIRDRRHQLNVYRYILRHADEGAWVWAWKKDGENGSVETP
jgi:hypothetical protein